MQEIIITGKKKLPVTDADFALDFEGTNGSKVFTNTGKKVVQISLVSGGPVISTAKKINGSSSGAFGSITGDSLSLGNTASFPGDFTIEAWVNQNGSGNPTYSGGFQMLVSLNRVLSDMVYCLCIFENKIAFKSVTASGTYGTIAIGSTTVPLGVWAHLAFTRKDGIVKLWLNGKLEATSALWNLPFASTTAFYVGNCHDARTAGTGGYCGMNGNIDRFRMYSSCLYTENFTPSST